MTPTDLTEVLDELRLRSMLSYFPKEVLERIAEIAAELAVEATSLSCPPCGECPYALMGEEVYGAP